jgi:hypothetical protein
MLSDAGSFGRLREAARQCDLAVLAIAAAIAAGAVAIGRYGLLKATISLEALA